MMLRFGTRSAKSSERRQGASPTDGRMTPEECGRAVMKVFLKIRKPWGLTRKDFLRVIGNRRCVEQGLKYAMRPEQNWIWTPDDRTYHRFWV